MKTVTVSPRSCLIALVTSSLVSRAATSGSTGASQAAMAAWTWRRASDTASGPVVSRTRRECRSVGRVGAQVVIRTPSEAGWSGLDQRSWLGPIALQIVLQVADLDIGQVTDFALMSRSRPGTGGR